MRQKQLRWRNVTMAFVSSIVLQGLVLGNTFSQLPNRETTAHKWCLGHPTDSICQYGANGLPLINWTLVCADVFQNLSFILAWVLIVGGVYALVADPSIEALRERLSGSQMSLLSSRQILLDKLLGIPALLYLGLGAIVPLHFAMGVAAGYPLDWLLTFYGLLGAITLCFYLLALWLSFSAQQSRNLQSVFLAFILSFVSLLVLFISWFIAVNHTTTDWVFLFNPLHILTYWNVDGMDRSIDSAFLIHGYNRIRRLTWFAFPVGSRMRWLAMASFANAFVLSSLLWQALTHHLRPSMVTPPAQQKRYGWVLYLSVMAVGFFI